MRFREFFDRIYIINLPERTDRRAEMEKELERVGMWPAPGRVEFFPAIKVTDAAGFPNAGYRGCFLSHLEVLKKAGAEDARNVLIFEDDAELAPPFREDEESLIEQLQRLSWGLVYFGHNLGEFGARPTTLIPHKGAVGLTHFYAVNGPVLERLIDFMEQILRRPPGHPDGGPMSPDGALHFFLSRNPDVPYYVTAPNLARQRSSRSDLMPRWFDKVPGLRQAASALRRVKRWFKRR
jgi:hypothetical protein